MTKRRKQRTEAQKASARRGREAASAASIPNAAAIVLATAGAPAPPYPRAVSAAIGRFDRTPTTLVQSGLLLQLLPSRLMQSRWTRWTPLRFTPQHPFQPQQPGPNELALRVVKVALTG
jgi:hypothetical protein